MTAALAIGVAGMVAGSAHAAFPGDNGKIAFVELVGGVGGSFDVFSIDSDGTGLTNLTNSPDEFERYPDWSPDGTQVAYARTGVSATTGIWTMAADGSGKARVSTDVPSAGLTWSPDGTKIAYFITVSASIRKLRTINSDGSGVPIDTAMPTEIRDPSFPEWSPDGTRLVFNASTAASTRTDVYVINVNGTGLLNISSSLGEDAFKADWSPDSSTLVFRTAGSGAMTAPADGSGTPTPLANTVVGDPVFSPDGNRIAFTGTGGGLPPVFGLFVASVDGSSQTPVHPGTQVIEPDWQPIPVDPVEVLPPAVSKTAETFVQRERDWNIRKYADPDVGWDAKTGAVSVKYKVRVGSWLGPRVNPVVFGGVSVSNPNDVPIVVDGITDVLPGASCEVLSNTDGVTIPANNSLGFGYRCELPSVPKKMLTNTATVAWHAQGIEGVYEPVPATAPVDFSNAQVGITGIDSMAVTDTLWGDKTRVLAEDLRRSRTFTYTRYLRAANKCRVFNNTARLIPNRPAEPMGLDPLPQPDVDEGVFAKMMASVTVCPPPAKPGAEPGEPVVVVDNPGSKPTKGEVTPSTTPKGGVVVTDPQSAKYGRLRVAKRANTKRAVVGRNVVWTIRVRNTGKADLSNVILADRLPRQLRPVRVIAGKDTRSARRRNVLRFRIGDLLVGESRTIRVVTRVVGKPRMDATNRRAIAQSKGRTRRVLHNRARKGIVCNTAMAKAGNTRITRGIGCIRVIAPRPVPAPEQPAEENIS